ncbi:MAG: selenocysteine-specific translation elongation factor [Firmicutes bacterium]|nr:selenocysteine-specific translation elongation factor [Bacillota bacterium]
MKHIIIGTAGHIDHGKTALIKSLTQIETDRLKEEKERGISIDLGFAYFDLPSGRRAGIIDVPGHERFIKNMLAGVSGIDLVLLVVAADEGMMPQTFEHLNILSFLNIKKGVIVVTKKDLVDDDWLQLVTQDIHEEVKGTFLEGSPVIPVSSKTGEGLQELVEVIDAMTEAIEPKDVSLPFRMPIDRVFTISGFGTIVTGTLISGRIRVNDEGEVMPQGYISRVRSLQVHGTDVNEALAGQRVAINLVGIKIDEIHRGDVFAQKGLLRNTEFLDCSLTLLKGITKPLKNLERVRLHIGAKEVICRCVLLDKKELNPGEKAFVQFRLEEPVAALPGDRYVLRTYSPLTTIGGGEVLKVSTKREKAFNKKIINELLLREKGTSEELLSYIIMEKSPDFPVEGELFNLYGRRDFKATLERLIINCIVIKARINQKDVFLHKDFLNRVENKIIEILREFHKKFPLKRGISKEELREKLKLPSQGFQLLLDKYEKKGTIKSKEGIIALKDFQVSYSPEQEKLKVYIEDLYLKGGFTPPGIEELFNSINSSKEEIASIYNSMIEMGLLIKVREDIVFHSEYYSKAKELLLKYLKEKGKINLGEFRDLLKTTRKFALPLLEHFDDIRLTRRVDDERVLR